MANQRKFHNGFAVISSTPHTNSENTNTTHPHSTSGVPELRSKSFLLFVIASLIIWRLPTGAAFLTFAIVDYPTKTVQVDKANMDDVVMDKNAPENLVVIKDHNDDGVVSVRGVKKPNDDGVVSVRGVKKPGNDPLYLVKSANGKIKKVDSLESISPNDIKTMSVFKDDKVDQFKKYGDTSNGVVLVELK